MKKFFQRIDQSKSDSVHSHCHSSSFVGKSFVVGNYTVTVVDTIAEGNIFGYLNFLKLLFMLFISI